MRDFVEGDLEAFLPENMVSYATGPRPGVDAPGTGPGMYYALWVADGLRSRGCSCFSGLCVGGGADWKMFLDKLGGPKARCKNLIVVQTKAFFESKPCLQEIYTALQAGVRIIPVIFEAGALDAPHWPSISSSDIKGQESFSAL